MKLVKDGKTHPQPAGLRPLAHPKYRPDIDGLRAIAVLSVVGYHAFPNWIPGGFIGVDVFFVISGFLISGILFDNLAKGSFSFREFYARRITRIFPALILVLTASLVFGWLVLVADEFRQLGKHVAAGAGFISNLVFWQEAGYFDNAADTKPLLHLWSLGVEEQFYIGWPLLVYFSWKRKVSLLGLTVTVAALSFALNIASLQGAPEATFYSPLTRFWELLLGGLLAHSLAGKLPVRPASVAHAQSLIGGALIGIGVLLVSKSSVFPGWWALLPTVGACLLISAGPQAWLNRVLLSRRGMVWFGLISYPLYLWHWPLLSFARIVTAGTPVWPIRVALVLLAVALAWLTYRLVERPIRSGGRRRGTVITLCVLTLAIGVAGYVAYLSGNQGRPDTEALAPKASPLEKPAGPAERPASENDAPRFVDNKFAFDWQKDEYLSAQCQTALGKWFISGRCRIQNPDAPPTVVLIGDSHARSLFEPVAAAASRLGGNVVMLGKRGCPTLLDVARLDDDGFGPYDDCAEVMQRSIDYVTSTPGIGTVVLTGRFALMISGVNFGAPQFGPDLYKLRKLAQPGITDRETIFRLGLEQLINTLTGAGKKVILVLDNPELDFDPRACLPERGGRCTMDRLTVDNRQARYRTVVSSVVSKNKHVSVIDLMSYLCDVESCRISSDGYVLYLDHQHLGVNGSIYLIRNGFSARLAELMTRGK